MDGWIALFLALYFLSLPVFFFFVAGALAPAASGPQLSPQSASTYLWLSALMSPEAGARARARARPCSDPISAQTTTAASRSDSSVFPSIMQPIVPSCSPHISLFTPTFASLACLLAPRVCFSCSLTHSDTQSAMNPTISNHEQPHIHTGHIKLPPMYSVI